MSLTVGHRHPSTSPSVRARFPDLSAPSRQAPNARPLLTRLQLKPLLPLIVLVIGTATAVTAGFLGVTTLRNTSDQVAQNRADSLASTLAPRLRSTTDQAFIVRRAARRSGAEILVASHDGTIVVDSTIETPVSDHVLRMLINGHGETTTKFGRTMFAARPLGAPFDTLSVIVMVSAPKQPAGTYSLVSSLFALTVLVLGVAVVVAFIVTRQIESDVDFVGTKIEAMAQPETGPIGVPIRIAMVDQIGALTQALNVLMDRFSAAQKAYERDLEHAAALDRHRSSFLATLSHELRTPLNAILGFADVLLSEVDGPLDADTRENLETVRASGANLRGLIDDILELSAIESGQLRLSPNVVDVRALADDVVREAAAWVGDKPIALHVQGPSPTLTFADERRLWQVVSNLVNNAIKFTDAGRVVVSTAVLDQNIELRVTDTGPGIEPRDLAYIFDAFRQAGAQPARAKGTGLGLFIARRLVQMHGGTIDVRAAPDQGTEFVIRLQAYRPGSDDTHELPPPNVTPAPAASRADNSIDDDAQEPTQ